MKETTAQGNIRVLYSLSRAQEEREQDSLNCIRHYTPTRHKHLVTTTYTSRHIKDNKMQILTLFINAVILSLGGASIIPVMRGTGHEATGATLLSAYTRRAPVDINAVLEPQNFADVQVDRRKAFSESL
ncbi:hypothetical protein GGR55DRAFT_646416 [Xylaria sp. FL0064]|nr:hypothetical protein GGR55DRAFT_646416 [Xylaria sp. FL0064]